MPRYVDTGEAEGGLAAEIDGEVSSVNADMGRSDGYFSISTIEEDDARRRRIELRQARAEGVEEGTKQGIRQGIEQGLEQGISRGRREANDANDKLIHRLFETGIS